MRLDANRRAPGRSSSPCRRGRGRRGIRRDSGGSRNRCTNRPCRPRSILKVGLPSAIEVFAVLLRWRRPDRRERVRAPGRRRLLAPMKDRRASGDDTHRSPCCASQHRNSLPGLNWYSFVAPANKEARPVGTRTCRAPSVSSMTCALISPAARTRSACRRASCSWRAPHSRRPRRDRRWRPAPQRRPASRPWSTAPCQPAAFSGGSRPAARPMPAQPPTPDRTAMYCLPPCS